MSVYKGTTLIAGISTHTNENAHSLFDFKWTDHKLNDVSWLEASIFSWQSKDVYTSAYNHIAQDIQGITSETETVGSYTVTFYRATDGHKICLADQEQTVLNIYNESGIAWYYILDTTNTQFKLPRTKYGFEGLRTNVGDNIDESLPNIKGTAAENSTATEWNYSDNMAAYFNGALYVVNKQNSGIVNTGSGATKYQLGFDASRSSSTYQDNAPVQERATQMYLYFYVGDYSQSAIEQTAGLNAELFNGKADTDLTNTTNTGYIKMAGASMPSNKYIDLTLGASPSTYTAPANGWFCINMSTSAAAQYINMINNTSGFAVESGTPAKGNWIRLFLPVLKNDVVVVGYSASEVELFRFYYAKGSESEAS